MGVEERDLESIPRSPNYFCTGCSHSIPVEPSHQKGVAVGVTCCSLSATQHMIYAKLGGSSQTAKATARESMQLIEKQANA